MPERSTRLTAEQMTYLDLVRAVAAQAVVVQHAIYPANRVPSPDEIPLGAIGVTVFFLLSGFLIAYTTRARLARGMTLAQFLITRACRIQVCFVPALIFVALVGCYWPAGNGALPATGPSDPGPLNPARFDLWQFIGNLLMLQDYPAFQAMRRLGWDSASFVRPFPLAEPGWTVAIEFWLYIGFGIVVFWLASAGRRLSWPMRALLLTAAVPIVCHGATGFGQCLTLVWLAGAAMQYAIDLPQRVMQRFRLAPQWRSRLIAGWTGLFAVMILMRMGNQSGPAPAYELQLALLIAGLMLGLLWACEHTPLLRARPLAHAIGFFARLSYPLYLVHYAVLAMLGARLVDAHDAMAPSILLLMLLASNLMAIPFLYLFDQHYQRVARWLIARLDGARAVTDPSSARST